MYNNDPKIPFEFREPLSKYVQDTLHERHTWWQITGCRKDFTCMNHECSRQVRTYQYYYKYHNRRYNHIPYYIKSNWLRVCNDCYFDHICKPLTPSWNRHQERKMEEQQANIERTYPHLQEQFEQARKEIEGEIQ